MDTRKAILVLMVLVLAGGGAWYAVGRARMAAQNNQSSQRYLYCPNCRLEFFCSPAMEKRVVRCPKCVKNGVVMDIYSYSHKSGAGNLAPPNKWVPITSIGITGLLAALWLILGRLQKNGGFAEAASYYYNCPGCRRRLRYTEKKAGQQAICPLCRKTLTLPFQSGMARA